MSDEGWVLLLCSGRACVNRLYIQEAVSGKVTSNPICVQNHDKLGISDCNWKARKLHVGVTVKSLSLKIAVLPSETADRK